MTTTLISDSASIRWAAIGAGFLVSVVAGMLLNLLGIGLGFMAFPFYKASAATFGVTSIVWCVATGMVSMFLGGWTAGFFSHTLKRKESLLYGVVTWSLATLIGVFFLFGEEAVLLGGLAVWLSLVLKLWAQNRSSCLEALLLRCSLIMKRR